MQPTITAAIAELERELNYRKINYPDLIWKGLLTKKQADERLAAMELALKIVKAQEVKQVNLFA